MIQLPLFEPQSAWTPPARFPDLSDAKVVSLDTENHDPYLKQTGPSFIRKAGHVAGVSVFTDTGFRGYFPVGHALGANLDKGIVSRWLREVCSKNRDYVFTNAPYDMGWLSTLNVEVKGRIHDISIAATLLDEEDPKGYSLDHIGRRYTGEGKDETKLREAALEYGLDPKADLWKLPAKFVGAYAEKDPELTYKAYVKLRQELTKQGLDQIYDLECQVTPILYRMWRRGIRVDTDYAERLNARWKTEVHALLRQLRMDERDIWSSEVIARFCDDRSIVYPRTEKGNPSITKDFMEKNGHPDLLPLRKVRAIQRTQSVYLEQNLLRDTIDGRIFPQYVQLASDEGGTRTGRLACKNPNAQQFPKRSRLFDAKSIRKCLIPEEGKLWAKFDYWSQEPTLQCHYGLQLDYPGAAEVRTQFEQGVKLYTFIEKATGGRCNYDQAKEVVLGRSYGMGAEKMASRMGIPEHECDEILRAFDTIVPYISMLAEHCDARAKQRGWVRTILGRKRHFDLFGRRAYRDPDGNWIRYNGPGRRLERWLDDGLTADKLERLFTYKAFNALIQGGSADQTKMSLILIDRELGLPQMTVHDEISKSVADEQEALAMKRIMETSVKLLCPVRADMELGSSWV